MVDGAGAAAGAESDETQACAHHWQIETPSGETSQGICKLCGATREFANYSAGRTMTRSAKMTQGSSSSGRVSV